MSSEWDRRTLLTALAALAACRSGGPFVETPTEVSRTLPFVDEPGPLGVITGDGLDQRLAIDLAQRPTIVANDAFYIRTGPPLGLVPEGWSVDVDGAALTADELVALASDQGVVLLECSGNGVSRGFGLIRAAAWSGVLLTDLLDLEGDPLIEVVG